MQRVVTGLFYEAGDAPRAVEALKAAGVAPERIYLEREVVPGGEIGRRGRTLIKAERERRIAGLESGVIIGLGMGLLAGGGVAMMAEGMATVMRSAGTDPPTGLMMTHPWVALVGGLLIGALMGGLIGWIVDYTLDRIGAGPALPMEETLVSVQTDDSNLDRVYSAMSRARVRHLHVADGYTG